MLSMATRLAELLPPPLATLDALLSSLKQCSDLLGITLDRVQLLVNHDLLLDVLAFILYLAHQSISLNALILD